MREKKRISEPYLRLEMAHKPIKQSIVQMNL